MTRVDERKLDKISGGDATVSGPIINAIVNVIELIRQAGYDLGSGFRRMAEDKICPLE